LVFSPKYTEFRSLLISEELQEFSIFGESVEIKVYCELFLALGVISFKVLKPSFYYWTYSLSPLYV